MDAAACYLVSAGAWAMAPHLATELGQRATQRSAGDLKHSLERPVELEDQKIAPATDNEQTQRTAITVAFRGAKSPKLAKMMHSQNTRTTRNGTGIELPKFSNSSRRVRPTSSAIVRLGCAASAVFHRAAAAPRFFRRWLRPGIHLGRSLCVGHLQCAKTGPPWRPQSAGAELAGRLFPARSGPKRGRDDARVRHCAHTRQAARSQTPSRTRSSR